MGSMSMGISYICDISSSEKRTSIITTLYSLWYLGGPIGTAVLGAVLGSSTENVALLTMLGCFTLAVMYILFFTEETIGPFSADNKRVDVSKTTSLRQITREELKYSTMARDFFTWKRVKESFLTLFQKRDDYDRAIILLSVTCNMARRGARGKYSKYLT